MAEAGGRRRLPPTVVALGVVSLLTDVASEMIYPLLPAFLLTLGAGGAFVGLVDGVAETVAAALKLASGWWADRVSRRKPLVVVGYTIAAVMRPLMAVARVPWHVLVVRATDRIGKGLRSTPRDAMLAAAADPDRRGAAFGFHRAMDHAGALIGPLLAYALVGWFAASHRTVFALATVPGAVAVLVLVLAVREERKAEASSAAARAPSASSPGPSAAAGVGGSLSRPSDTRPLGGRFAAYIACLALFTLGNASDFFLLLRAQELGIPLASLPLLWAALHAVKSGLSTPLSALSDRLGRKRVILAGWTVYALTYAGFAAARSAWQAWALFIVYGIYYAFTEGTEKALVADLAAPEARGRAFGIYNFTLGICLLPASLGFGLIWDGAGHGVAFLVAAGLALLASVGLLFVRTARPG